MHPGFSLLPALGTVRNDMGVFGGPYCTIIGSSIISIRNLGKNSVINGYVLYQNYPNPFNPVTLIRFQVQKNSTIKISVFNSLGQNVINL